MEAAFRLVRRRNCRWFQPRHQRYTQEALSCERIGLCEAKNSAAAASAVCARSLAMKKQAELILQRGGCHHQASDLKKQQASLNAVPTGTA